MLLTIIISVCISTAISLVICGITLFIFLNRLYKQFDEYLEEAKRITYEYWKRNTDG
ncbi:MAG: hypothetical protein K2O52_02260 [Oscillospiraceae bacterium]|nr:hypothetical protein [Oscillospiraceae bacterium]MDE7093714.1 hypothetical protein [Oscillospiraceae bacterium]